MRLTTRHRKTAWPPPSWVVVEKAGDELCSFRVLMHRNLAARAHARLPRAGRFPRMTSWLVRALLGGGRCRGLGWTAGVYSTGSQEAVRWSPVTRRPDRQMRRLGLKTGSPGRTSGLAETRASGEGSLGNFPRSGRDDPSAEPNVRRAQTRSLHADRAVESFPDPPPQGSDPPREARGAACRLQRRQGGGFGCRCGILRDLAPGASFIVRGG
jgi:hypothetical protein